MLPLLLLLCRAGAGAKKGFAAIPDNSEDTLRNWNSEGAAPENKVSSLYLHVCLVSWDFNL